MHEVTAPARCSGRGETLENHVVAFLETGVPQFSTLKTVRKDNALCSACLTDRPDRSAKWRPCHLPGSVRLHTGLG